MKKGKFRKFWIKSNILKFITILPIIKLYFFRFIQLSFKLFNLLNLKRELNNEKNKY